MVHYLKQDKGYIFLFPLLQEEDLAMIAAQQYFIEYNNDMNSERLLNLLPNYIPDYCLSNAEKSVERWKQLVVQAYKKVIFLLHIQF